VQVAEIMLTFVTVSVPPRGPLADEAIDPLDAVEPEPAVVPAAPVAPEPVDPEAVPVAPVEPAPELDVELDGLGADELLMADPLPASPKRPVTVT
jgi:hypothetical protein